MSGEPVDLSVFPAQVQAYVTVGVSIVLGIVGIYGYYKKFRGDPPPSYAADASPNTREIVGWLDKLLDANLTVAANTKAILDVVVNRTHQDDIDRAYLRGRHEAEDSRR